MHVYFETERLIVRQYTLDDVGELHRVMADGRVHAYTKDKGRPWDERRTEAYIRDVLDRDFRTLDCFHGVVIEKGTGRLIGLCGLNPYLTRRPEIEWKLGAAHWGRGYATELGRQMICEAFTATDVRGIYGMAMPENAASRRVLEKIGMKYLGERMFRDHEASFYYIANLK